MRTTFFHPLVLAAALGLGLMGQAGAAQYTSLDDAASSIQFGYSQMNVKMDGRFAELKASELSFDPARPEAANVSIEVVLSSIDAGYAEANSELEKDEWLALATHPAATFTSRKVESRGENRYQVTGALTIKGVTKEVTAPFTLEEDGDAAVFAGNFTFQRADFGIGEGQWEDFGIVANDIQIRFNIVAKP